MAEMDKPVVCPNPNCKRIIDDNTLREALLKEAKVVKCPHCGEEIHLTHETIHHRGSKFMLPPDFKQEKG